MKHTICFLISALFLLGNIHMHAQNDSFSDVISKVEQRYAELETYAMDVSYRYSLANNPEEHQEDVQGEIFKDGPNYYSRIDQTEMVFIEDSFLKINHNERAVLYSEFQENAKPGPLQLSSLTNYFCEIQEEKQGDYILYTLIFNQAPAIPYSKMEVLIDPNKLSLKAQHLYLIPGRSTPGNDPNMQVTEAGVISIFFNENDQINTDSDRFNIEKYLTLGSEITLSKNLATYRLFQSN